VTLQPGQFLGARVGDTVRFSQRPPPPEMPGAEAVTVMHLPIRLVGLAANKQTVHLRPAVILEAPLRYRPDEHRFRGSLLVALEDSLSPSTSKRLSGPVRLTFVSDEDSITPSELELASTNRPLSRVTVLSSRPMDSARVAVHPEFDLRGVNVWLRVRPVFDLDGGPRSIAGLGIQTAIIPLRIRGASILSPVIVKLSTDRGSLEEDSIEIGPSGSVSVRLRSAGIGTAIVTASSPGIDGANAPVQFTWPIYFLLAALLGGAIGGYAGHVNRKHSRRRDTRRAVKRGVIIGFAAAVVYFAVDVNLLPIELDIPFFNEGAVFAFALLGGLLGLGLLTPVGQSRSDGENNGNG
jgi:hypothetical protein